MHRHSQELILGCTLKTKNVEAGFGKGQQDPSLPAGEYCKLSNKIQAADP